MPHPIAVHCAAGTIDAALKSADADDRLAASGADDMERLAKSREAVARSAAGRERLSVRRALIMVNPRRVLPPVGT
jgi:hypothetical protein